MPFDITLYTNSSENNRVTKTLTAIATLTGTLREETSIIDPIIKIEYDLSALTACNYMHIPTFGRYYFINNIRSIRTGLCELHAHVDVLMSFAEAIKANTAIIKRQEKDWNLYLNDGSFKVYQPLEVVTKEFPSGFSAQKFVLAVAGAAPSS